MDMQASLRGPNPAAMLAARPRNLTASPEVLRSRRWGSGDRAHGTGPQGHLVQRRRTRLQAHAYLTPSSLPDFYEVLGVDDDADFPDIKRAYRDLAKACHPDVHTQGHDLQILLNEAYTTLMDPMRRLKYNAALEQALQDEEDDYTGQPLSKWLVGHRLGKASSMDEKRAVFVDEASCIGCKQCVWLASATFRIDSQYGRSRVYAQWINQEDQIDDAIASCPVDCIHWVDKEQLPALEYVTRHKLRINTVANMMTGAATADVFAASHRFLKDRETKLKKRSKIAQQYSPAQEASRRRAAGALHQQRLAWMGPFASVLSSVHGAWKDSLASVDYDGKEEADDPTMQVGRRRRSASMYNRVGRTAQGATIPIERSLVPLSLQPEFFVRH